MFDYVFYLSETYAKTLKLKFERKRKDMASFYYRYSFYISELMFFILDNNSDMKIVKPVGFFYEDVESYFHFEQRESKNLTFSPIYKIGIFLFGLAYYFKYSFHFSNRYPFFVFYF